MDICKKNRRYIITSLMVCLFSSLVPTIYAREFKDFTELRIGTGFSFMKDNYYPNSAGGFDFGGMCSLINAIAQKRENFFISDWFGVSCAVGKRKNGDEKKWYNLRFDFSLKTGFMIGENGDIFARAGYLTGRNEGVMGAYDALFIGAGFNSAFFKAELAFGKNGTVTSKYGYFMSHGAFRIPRIGGLGVKYERFLYKDFEEKVSNLGIFYEVFL